METKMAMVTRDDLAEAKCLVMCSRKIVEDANKRLTHAIKMYAHVRGIPEADVLAGISDDSEPKTSEELEWEGVIEELDERADEVKNSLAETRLAIYNDIWYNERFNELNRQYTLNMELLG